MWSGYREQWGAAVVLSTDVPPGHRPRIAPLVVQDQDGGGRVSSARRLSQVRSALPPARLARTRLVFMNRGFGVGPDGQVGEGLGDVALADAHESCRG
jgi:hypothetical protein